MSASEQQAESRSSVAIALNAKGDPQITVKAYVGEDHAALIEAQEQAVDIFKATFADLYGQEWTR